MRFELERKCKDGREYYVHGVWGIEYTDGDERRYPWFEIREVWADNHLDEPQLVFEADKTDHQVSKAVMTELESAAEWTVEEMFNEPKH